MKKIKVIGLAACLVVGARFGISAGQDTANVFIGTSGLGHATPAATVPFGMVQAGPDTSAKGEKFVSDWTHCSGYQHEDRFIWRFSQTHLSGTGMIGLGDLGVLPLDEKADAKKAFGEKIPESEKAEPGAYEVRFTNGIGTEIAASAHSAAYRFSFPKGRRARVLVDLDWHAAGFSLPNTNFYGVFSCFIRDSRLEVAGKDACRGFVKLTQCFNRDVFFAMRSSCPLLSAERVAEPAPHHGSAYVLDFGTPADGVVELRLALSRNSETAAEGNLAAEMPKGAAFGKVRAAAAAAWAQVLGRVRLDPATPEATRTSFNAALYRLFFQPNACGDVGGAEEYSTFSLWDTFRAAHPLYTILAPERVDGLVASLVRSWERDGHLPIWQLWGEETHCMIGKHAVPVVVDAYLKGFRGFDAQKAFAAVVETLTKEHEAKSTAYWGQLKEDWPTIDRYGYLPFDGIPRTVRGRSVTGETVSRLLEGSYDDACAARFAAALGEKEKAAFFAKRSGNWKNVFDPSLGCVRGKDKQGRWREPFDPFQIGHGWVWSPDNDFTEGNALQYTWHVMQDPEGLVAALGGREKALRKLRELFEADPTKGVEAGEGDSTGRIGQYAHGNEPSHHIIYFFTLLGRPDLAGKYIRQVFDTQYGPRPDGLCGNDDCGQMAAWYVFSALGFYPFDPCGGEYVVGAPQVAGATVALPGGRTLRIEVRNFAKENTSVESVALNGRPVADFRLRHADLMKGGTLTYVMRR